MLLDSRFRGNGKDKEEIASSPEYGLARNDKCFWIPAFAGMTNGRLLRRWRSSQ